MTTNEHERTERELRRILDRHDQVAREALKALNRPCANAHRIVASMIRQRLAEVGRGDEPCANGDGPTCRGCRESGAHVEERFSLGITAGNFCDPCWDRSGYRKEGREGFDPAYAGESYEGE